MKLISSLAPRRSLTLSLLWLVPFFLFSQSLTYCPIGVGVEPTNTKQSSTASKVNQVFFNPYIPWGNVENMQFSDDFRTEITLQGFKRSRIMRLSDFRFRIPQGAAIEGIEVRFEGKSSQFTSIDELSIILKAQGGSKISNNKANHAKSQFAWRTGRDGRDGMWTYGGAKDKWGLSLTSEEINATDFTFEFQIRNMFEQELIAQIDQIEVIVYYKPLYTVCDDDCLTFFVDKMQQASGYNWHIPDGFIEKSRMGQYTIDLGLGNVDFGNYEICVDVLGQAGQILESCCRSFNYVDCSKNEIKGLAWEDINNNGLRDINEPFLPNVDISLFLSDGTFVESMTTNSDGQYHFKDLNSGDYFLKTATLTNRLFVLKNIAFPTRNSDITNTNGLGTTDVITLFGGVCIENIDFGYLPTISIGDFVWEDMNYNGLQDIDELGIDGVVVFLFDHTNLLIASTVTDQNGFYIFESIPTGQYQITYEIPLDFKSTCKNSSNPTINSKINDQGNTIIYNFATVSTNDTIDAGFYKQGLVTGTVWEDSNGDGVLSNQEFGMANVEVKLFGVDGCGADVSIAVFTDSTGQYSFDTINPGTYQIEVIPPTGSRFTRPNLSPNPQFSSIVDENGLTPAFTIFSGGVVEFQNAGIYKYGQIGDFVWHDLNANGLQDQNEPGIEGLELLLSGQNGFGDIVQKSIITDTNGQYIFDQLDPGIYDVSFQLPDNFRLTLLNAGMDVNIDNDAFDSKIESIIINSGDVVNSKDIGLYKLSSIGDFVWEDLNGNGIQDVNELGISGVSITLNGTNIFGLNVNLQVETNEGGQYLFDQLDPGDYKLSLSTGGFYNFTTISLGMDNEKDSDFDATGNTAIISLLSDQQRLDIDAGLIRGGSIGDFVWEDMNCDGIHQPNEPGLAGVLIQLSGITGAGEIINLETFSDVNGHYLFQNLKPGIYNLNVVPLPNYYFTLGMISFIVLESGQSLLQFDAPLFRKATLGGRLWSDEDRNGIQDVDEIGLPNIKVTLTTLIQGELVEMSTFSDSVGNYLFTDLKPGIYDLNFALPNLFKATLRNAGAADVDSDIDENGNVNGIVLVSGAVNLTIDAGIYRSTESEIGDFVWEDVNGNGIQDNGERGLPFTLIILNGIDENGDNVYRVELSDLEGRYNFAFLKPGEYSLQFFPPIGYNVTKQNAGNGSNDSKPDPIDGIVSNIILAQDQVIEDIDAGFFLFGSIGDFVWLDINDNGLQDDDEPGIEGIQLSLVDAETDEVVFSTTSDPSGAYAFNAVAPGGYYLVADVTSQYSIVDINTTDFELNSDFFEFGGVVRTENFTISSGQTRLDFDLGLQGNVTGISGQVWRDINANGVLESGEPLLNGIQVTLLTPVGDTVLTTFTDSSGVYSFTDLEVGSYVVAFQLSDSLTYTSPFQGGNTEKDSDVTNVKEGKTNIYNITSGTQLLGVNAGYAQKSSLGNFVWLDSNENGLQDLDENGLNGIKIFLYEVNGQLLDSVVSAFNQESNRSGFYLFEELLPGDYYVKFSLPNTFLFTNHDPLFPDINSDVTGFFGEGTTDTIRLLPQTNLTNISAGYIINSNAPASLSGLVWLDRNNNAIRDDDELKLDGIEVKLYDVNGVNIDFVFTDEQGAFSFPNLTFGDYYLSVPDFANRVFVLYTGQNTDRDSEITNGFGPGTSRLVTIFPGDNIVNFDMGYAPKISIGDFVWDDLDGNGLQDVGEPGLPNVAVELFNEAGVRVASTVTNTLGRYVFNNIASGSYSLKFGKLNGYVFTDQVPSVLDLNSKADENGQVLLTSFPDQGDYLNIDAGLVKAGTIGDRVWLDLNGNGVYQNNEPGISNVQVRLFTEAGQLVKTTVTGSNGSSDFAGLYKFEGVRPGNYYIIFDIPTFYLLSPPFIGGPDIDSDITNAFGRGSTDVFTVGIGQVIEDIDAGAYLPATIGDRVWLDENMNGNQDPDEEGVEGITVSLFTQGGQLLQTTVTDTNGIYRFENLRQRLYFLQFSLPDGFKFTLQNMGTSSSTDSDVDATGTTPLISLAHGSTFLDVDAGIFPTSNKIVMGTIWEDLNENSMKEDDEELLQYVRVSLLNGDGDQLATAFTNHAGMYSHELSQNGQYYIQVYPKEEYAFPDKSNHATAICNDVDKQGYSEMLESVLLDHLTYVNACMYYKPLSSVSGNIWLDQNDNNLFDAGIDSPMADVLVLLFNQQKIFVKSTKTDLNGNYLIKGLDMGAYYIMIPTLVGKSFIMYDEVNEFMDSQITNKYGVGTSSLFALSPPNKMENFNFGYKSTLGLQQPESTIEEKQAIQEDMVVYPNPTLWNLRVKIKDYTGLVDFRILNHNGAVIKNGQISTDENEVDLTNVPNGLYVMEVEYDGKVQRQQFLRIDNY